MKISAYHIGILGLRNNDKKHKVRVKVFYLWNEDMHLEEQV
jgi:hypothetical protein